MEIRGDLNVGRVIEAGRRINTGVDDTNSNDIELDKYSHQMLLIDTSTVGSVRLPNATSLPLGWNLFVSVAETSQEVNVKTYHESVPVNLKEIISGRAYEFVLLDNDNAEGVWLINYLEEADLIPTERFIVSFTIDIGGDNWTSESSGYHTIVINGSTHGRGARPTVQVFKDTGDDLIQILPDQIKIAKSDGDVTIRVPSDPNLRFAGSVILV